MLTPGVSVIYFWKRELCKLGEESLKVELGWTPDSRSFLYKGKIEDQPTNYSEVKLYAEDMISEFWLKTSACLNISAANSEQGLR